MLWPSFHFCKMRVSWECQTISKVSSSFSIPWRLKWIFQVRRIFPPSIVLFPLCDSFTYQHMWPRFLKRWPPQRPWLMGVGNSKESWCAFLVLMLGILSGKEVKLNHEKGVEKLSPHHCISFKLALPSLSIIDSLKIAESKVRYFLPLFPPVTRIKSKIFFFPLSEGCYWQQS